MKNFLFCMLLSTLFISISHSKGFEEKKAKVLERIEIKIGHMNTLKSCVSEASGKDSLKACKESHKKIMEAFKEENKEMRSKRKAEKIRKLEEKLKKLKTQK